MDEPDEKKWSKRYSWAECGEPYKTELDTLGSHWIEGELSNGELAIEALEMLSVMDAAPCPRDHIYKAQLRILTEAMLGVAERPIEMQTPELRRQHLDHVKKLLSSPEEGVER
jgi:hypothetical protein